MSDNSPRLDLPLIQPAQAQKHVTHNEALRVLDVLVQLTVEAFDATTPPSLPEEGKVYALGAGAGGAWLGADGLLAVWIDGGWQFHQPRTGWYATLAGSAELRVFTGAAWAPLAGGTGSTENLPGVGVNTTSDANNRLAVSAPATLLSHEGAGHQLKVNKAATGDTASLLFQTNWSGRAEMGLAGDDAFSIKVSADGSSWNEALRLTPGTEVYHTGNAVGTVSATPGLGSAIIETGSNVNGRYVRFADGTQICTHRQQLVYNATVNMVGPWTYPAAFAAVPAVSGALDGTNFVATTGISVRQAGGITVYGPSNTSTTIVVYIGAGSTATFNAGDYSDVDVVATGRWF